MTYLSNLQRKIVFAVGILMLFGAMYPYKVYLQEEARKKDLGEATIGEIDTGSFMLKLFLLGGFRGVAANILWTRAIDFQKVQEWDRLKVTVDLITKLQPHFLAIWTFQSWNLTYNVSVEWDAPEDKYEWIKQGIKFIQDGVKMNSKSPDLVYDTAWYYYHKIGFSDESIILRRLFFDDTDESFKRSPLDANVFYRDNFQLARDWFETSVKLVDNGATRIISEERAEEDEKKRPDQVEKVDAPAQRKGRDGDLPFRSMPAHAQTRYAAGLEKESMKGIEAIFGPRAEEQWKLAHAAWVAFGTRVFKTPNVIPIEGKLVQMTYILDDNVMTNPEAWAKLHPNVQHWADRSANEMNYPYWKDRCAAEMEPEGSAARKLFYEGTVAYKTADFPLAVTKFKQGLQIWEKLLEHHQPYRRDDLNKKDTGLIVKRYDRACKQSGIELPKDTPFLDLLKAYENDPSRDPFDALEMLDNTTRSSSSKKQRAR